MAVPKIVFDLVARYKDNEESYRRDYGETETRREFLDPLFKALGWDIDNAAGNAEAYKDVVHEDSVKVGVTLKAPDYSFRVGGIRKFFLEAKRPGVRIKDAEEPAYQLRRYAWSAKLPLSILSNFSELAVYDCRIKPSQSDKPNVGRLMYFTASDYEEAWEQIASIFSKEAIYKGSFDRFALGKGRKGSAEVDNVFLEEIESWRDSLAKNIALRNPGLTPPELNFAVQQTIDRIVFLRICEDRGIESYGRLRQLLNGEHTYARLKQVFHDADDRYNSGLFHFQDEKGRSEPDALTLGLKIDDKTLKDILQHLYYPESPYEFSVLPADILGQVYEQFLGKVIRLTVGGHAKVEDKPEVKKAGGVYYTPTYIVDYIVKRTVGKLLAKSTPEKASKLRILDPACGSGSFLIGAYQYLLDWHRNWYEQNTPQSYSVGRNPKVYRGPNGVWRLTTAERKRILLNSIYGVDIDPQAVEVTKLSILLKVLEDESAESLGRNREIFHERALPDLDENIKCGNSIVGPDYFEGRLSLGDEEGYGINAFNWSAEFESVLKGGGFDAVIGNPPYVRMENFAELKDYLHRFAVFEPRADLYAYFVERASDLLKANGLLGMIVSNKWIKARYGGPLREFAARHVAIEELVDFGELPVFQNASTFPCILIAGKRSRPKASSEVISFHYVPIREIKPQYLEDQVSTEGCSVEEGPDHRGESWRLAPASILTSLLEYPSGLISLEDWLGPKTIGWGIKTGLNEAFILSGDVANAALKATPKLAEVIKPLLVGDDIRKYESAKPMHYLIYASRGFSLSKYKWIERHLTAFRKTLSERATVGTHPWYELQQPQPRYASMFEEEKIVWPEIAKEPRFTLVGPGIYLNNKCFFTNCNSRVLLGILNSRLAWELLKLMCSSLGDVNKGGRLELRQQYLSRFPIPKAIPKAIETRVSSHVEYALDQTRKLGVAKTPHLRNSIERQIRTACREIDQAVYELYGLDEEDQRTVEQAGNLGSKTA